MSGSTDLQHLLQHMKPLKQAGSYVFISIPTLDGVNQEDAAMIFRESEGYTLILERSKAHQMGFPDGPVMAWITLNVHSSLQAVGLTAAFSRALAQHGISCNVVAGFYHDHIFVPVDQADLALDALRALSAHQPGRM